MAQDDPSGTQKAPPRTPLMDAEFYLEEAARMGAEGNVEVSAPLFEAAMAAALVSLAKTMDDLNGKLGMCGHGYVGAFCHLCWTPR